MGKNKNTGRKNKASFNQLANLRPFNLMSPEEQAELSRKGAEASAAKRKQAQTFKDAATWLAKLPAFKTGNEAVKALMKQYPDLNNAEAMTMAIISKVLEDGDPKAFSTVRDTTGELPAQSVNVKQDEPFTINIKTIE